MAKNNGKNKNPIAKNNKRMKNNYFTSMIDRFGEDFLNTMDQGSLLNSIQRDSGRIVREILGGNIDMGACAK